MPSKNLREVASYLDPIARTSALFGGVLYIAGFLIINAYLSKYDLSDYNVISSRFIFAGASFSLVCAIWWVLCGRLHFYKELTDLAFESRYSRSDGIILSTTIALLLTARSISASMAICLFMFDSAVVVLPGAIIIGVLMLAEAIISAIQSESDEISRAALAVRSLLSISAIVIFFVMFRSKDDVLGLFFWITSLETVALPLGDIIKNNKVFDLKPLVSSVYYFLMIFFYTISYGHKFFDKVHTSVGGGLVYTAVINTKDPIILEGISNENKNVFSGTMLYSSDKLAVMKIKDNVVAIASEQIKATLIVKKVDPFMSYRMTKTIRRLGIPWRYSVFDKDRSRIHGAPYILNRSLDISCFYDWQPSCIFKLTR